MTWIVVAGRDSTRQEGATQIYQREVVWSEDTSCRYRVEVQVDPKSSPVVQIRRLAPQGWELELFWPMSLLTSILWVCQEAGGVPEGTIPEGVWRGEPAWDYEDGSESGYDANDLDLEHLRLWAHRSVSVGTVTGAYPRRGGGWVMFSDPDWSQAGYFEALRPPVQLRPDELNFYATAYQDGYSREDIAQAVLDVLYERRSRE